MSESIDTVTLFFCVWYSRGKKKRGDRACVVVNTNTITTSRERRAAFTSRGARTHTHHARFFFKKHTVRRFYPSPTLRFRASPPLPRIFDNNETMQQIPFFPFFSTRSPAHFLFDRLNVRHPPPPLLPSHTHTHTDRQKAALAQWPAAAKKTHVSRESPGAHTWEAYMIPLHY